MVIAGEPAHLDPSAGKPRADAFLFLLILPVDA
jgi:hypothetical protein